MRIKSVDETNAMIASMVGEVVVAKEKVAAHWRKNRRVYIGAAAGFAAGVAGSMLFRGKKTSINQLSPFSFSWKSEIHQTIIMNEKEK